MEKKESKEFYGYFHTLDHNGDTVCLEEKLDLDFYEGGRIKGKATGYPHMPDGTRKKRVWNFYGYRHGDEISLSYRTEGLAPTGHGVYFLMGTGEDRIGYWIGTDFPDGINVQCRYVLTEEKKQEDACTENWPRAFKGQNCRKLGPVPE